MANMSSVSPFQALPAELRIKIHKCLHLSRQAIKLTKDGLSGGYKCYCPLSAAMLRTCKEIYAESSGVLNSGNEFVPTELRAN